MGAMPPRPSAIAVRENRLLPGPARRGRACARGAGQLSALRSGRAGPWRPSWTSTRTPCTAPPPCRRAAPAWASRTPVRVRRGLPCAAFLLTGGGEAAAPGGEQGMPGCAAWKRCVTVCVCVAKRSAVPCFNTGRV